MSGDSVFVKSRNFAEKIQVDFPYLRGLFLEIESSCFFFYFPLLRQDSFPGAFLTAEFVFLFVSDLRELLCKSYNPVFLSKRDDFFQRKKCLMKKKRRN